MKNSMLVLVLAALLSIPLAGFGFISYKEPPPAVLGTSVPRKIRAGEGVEVVDQIDLRLNLSKDRVQKFYNVLEEEYMNSDDYQVILVVPQEVMEAGVDVELIENELSADLLVTLDEEVELPSLTVSLLVINPRY